MGKEKTGQDPALAPGLRFIRSDGALHLGGGAAVSEMMLALFSFPVTRVSSGGGVPCGCLAGVGIGGEPSSPFGTFSRSAPLKRHEPRNCFICLA